MKRQLTEAQKEKSAQRKERFRTLVKQVAGMTDVERAHLTSKIGAIVTCEGHVLSLTNTMLIIAQNPVASVVGGFRQWLKAGRCVRKGEHGQMIWVPTGGRKNDAPLDGSSTVSAVVDAEPKGENDTRFIIGTVFDIEQTQEIETAQAGKEAL